MTSYTVTIDRDEALWRVRAAHTVAAAKAEHSWHVEVPDLAVVAQARHLGELDEMAKDLVAIHTETSHGTLLRTCPITVISDSCQTTFPGR